MEVKNIHWNFCYSETLFTQNGLGFYDSLCQQRLTLTTTLKMKYQPIDLKPGHIHRHIKCISHS